ncbi:hypothetical protein P4O66_016101 [Electrophorus voltai]|uniref:Rap-GAP domain-containing protein n=1 Tax=Electrophorus voltai TaxID=2609070 RepID=A0AAD8YWA4_9TELE|nr:hypothetical protein P4O66_016101 [Electrophorus voltai]
MRHASWQPLNSHSSAVRSHAARPTKAHWKAGVMGPLQVAGSRALALLQGMCHSVLCLFSRPVSLFHNRVLLLTFSIANPAPESLAREIKQIYRGESASRRDEEVNAHGLPLRNTRQIWRSRADDVYGLSSQLISSDADGAIQRAGRFRVENGSSDEMTDYTPGTWKRTDVHLENPEYHTRWFFKYFLGKVHQNYVGVDAEKNPFYLSVVLSDQNNQRVPQYRAILWRKTGTLKISLPYSPTKTLSVKSILSAMNMERFEKGPREILNPEIQKDLLVLEEQEGSVNFKFGVLYAKDGQLTDDEMFSNELGSENFDKFLNLLGDTICLQGWAGYRGGLDTKNDTTGIHSIYTVYQGHELMFHVSTMLPYSKDNKQQSWESQSTQPTRIPALGITAHPAYLYSSPGNHSAPSLPKSQPWESQRTQLTCIPALGITEHPAHPNPSPGNHSAPSLPVFQPSNHRAPSPPNPSPGNHSAPSLPVFQPWESQSTQPTQSQPWESQRTQPTCIPALGITAHPAYPYSSPGNHSALSLPVFQPSESQSTQPTQIPALGITAHPAYLYSSPRNHRAPSPPESQPWESQRTHLTRIPALGISEHPAHPKGHGVQARECEVAPQECPPNTQAGRPTVWQSRCPVERKRHIGNDIVTIVFQEGDDASPSFKPSMIRSHFTHVVHGLDGHAGMHARPGSGGAPPPNSLPLLHWKSTEVKGLGLQPCPLEILLAPPNHPLYDIFALVRYNSQNDSYRLKIFSEESVPLFGPPLPSPPVFTDHQEFRDFLLVKLINGEKATLETPTFAQKRQRTLDMLIRSLYQDLMPDLHKAPFSPQNMLNRRSFSDVLPESPKSARKKEEARQAEFVRIGQVTWAHVGTRTSTQDSQTA